MKYYLIILILIIMTGACGGRGSNDNSDVTTGSSVADASLCPNGGYILKTGVVNDEGTTEIKQIEIICNGANNKDAPLASPVPLSCPYPNTPHPTKK